MQNTRATATTATNPTIRRLNPACVKTVTRRLRRILPTREAITVFLRKKNPVKNATPITKGGMHVFAKLDTVNFDHETTGFSLKGAHANSKVLCKDCHYPSKKYRDAPTKCNSCHQKADKHKGSLGPECQNCHEEKDWKTTHFDHSKTKFDLLGKHKEVKCKACHLNDKFKETPKLCNECHKKDDKHKGTFGPKCETCHNETSWKEIIFDHDKKTKYPLLGKHRKQNVSAATRAIFTKIN